MKALHCLVALALSGLAIASCGSSESETTRCAYSHQALRDLETAAAANDRDALRELEICYDFEGRTEDRQRIHKRRLELGEPEALDEEAMKLLNSIDSIPRADDRKVTLEQALELAIQSSKNEGSSDPMQDMTVKMIVGELKKFEIDE